MRRLGCLDVPRGTWTTQHSDHAARRLAELRPAARVAAGRPPCTVATYERGVFVSVPETWDTDQAREMPALPGGGTRAGATQRRTAGALRLGRLHVTGAGGVERRRAGLKPKV